MQLTNAVSHDTDGGVKHNNVYAYIKTADQKYSSDRKRRKCYEMSSEGNITARK